MSVVIKKSHYRHTREVSDTEMTDTLEDSDLTIL